MKSVTCPTCNVVSSVPEEARAFRCSNCGALVEHVDRRPRIQRRESANNSPLAKILVLALGAMLLLWMFGAFGDSCVGL